MNKKFSIPRIISLPALFGFCILFNTGIYAQEPDINYSQLFEAFKTAAKAPCGQRAEAIRLGKLIIEKFGNDELNKDVFEYVKKKVAIIEKEDEQCKLPPFGDGKPKDWKELFVKSKEIIAKEGDSPLALDVMLTLVSVGYELTAIEKNDTFNNDTINYARLAIQRIENGQTSQTKKWGVFTSFNTKENALFGLNYTTGYITYNKLSQKKEGLGYLYKATQFDGDKFKVLEIYTILGDYYFDQAAKDTSVRNGNADDNKSLAIAKGYADRAIDVFGRAHKLAVENKANKTQIDRLYKTLKDLYRFRFNLAPFEKADGLNEYVKNLISRPLPDPTSEVEPVWKD